MSTQHVYLSTTGGEINTSALELSLEHILFIHDNESYKAGNNSNYELSLHEQRLSDANQFRRNAVLTRNAEMLNQIIQYGANNPKSIVFTNLDKVYATTFIGFEMSENHPQAELRKAKIDLTLNQKSLRRYSEQTIVEAIFELGMSILDSNDKKQTYRANLNLSALKALSLEDPLRDYVNTIISLLDKQGKAAMQLLRVYTELLYNLEKPIIVKDWN